MRAVSMSVRATRTKKALVILLVHTAKAVYCQLGDIRKDFEKPSKSEERKTPSGKQVREFAPLYKVSTGDSGAMCRAHSALEL